MWQYIDYSPELYHHGILGQKWGVRRFQYADGTLTPAGRKRYRVDSEGNLVEKTKQERKADAKAEKKAKAEEQKKLRLERENETKEKKKARILASKDPKLIYENRDLFTYQELNDVYNRINMENNISKLTVKKGKTFSDSIGDMGKTLNNAASLVEGGSRFYNSIAKVTNAFTTSELPLIGEAKKTKRDKVKSDAEYWQNLVKLETAQHQYKNKVWENIGKK